MPKQTQRLSDIPLSELKQKMEEYGKKHSMTVRSSRKFLRNLGMNIDHDGQIVIL